MILPPLLLSLVPACSTMPSPAGSSHTLTCGPGFLVDGADCVPENCGVGRWGDLPVDVDTIFVDVSAVAGGDGTEGAPYATIERGLNRVAALGGGVIAVAAGTYRERLSLTSDHSGVRLAGRCREMVVLDGDVGGGDESTLTIDGGNERFEVSGLTLTGSPNIALQIRSGDVAVWNVAITDNAYVGVWAFDPDNHRDTTLAMDDCVIARNSNYGVFVEDAGTSVTLTNTVVASTRPDDDGAHGIGVQVEDGAEFSAGDCLIEENTWIGVFGSGEGTRISLLDTIVRDTQPDSDGVGGMGIEVYNGADLSVDGCLVEGNAYFGVIGVKPGSDISLRNTVVRNTLPDPGDNFGRGVEVDEGATVDIEGCIIDGNMANGLLAANPGSHASIRNSIVSNTLTTDNRSFIAAGIEAADGATIAISGCLVDQNGQMGVLAKNDGTEVMLLNSRVRRTLPKADGTQGMGVDVELGAALTVEGSFIEENTEIGLSAYGKDTRVVLRDSIVRDTQPNAHDEGGWGILVSDGAIFSAERTVVEGNAGIGLGGRLQGTQITLKDSVVRHTQPDANDLGGRGIEVIDGATLILDGSSLDGNTDIGLMAVWTGTNVTIRNSVVSGTKSGSLYNNSSAAGIMVQEGAIVAASGLVITSNEGPGLVVNTQGTTMECKNCTIVDNQFAGVAVLADGFVSIVDSTIEGTTSNANLLGGAGIYAWSWLGGPPTLHLTSTVVRDNPVAGVWLIGNGNYVFEGNSISGGEGETFSTGSRCGDAILALDGVLAWDGSTGLLLRNNVIQESGGAGIFLDGSTASLSGNTYARNTQDLVVQNQSCDSLPDYSEALERTLCPAYNYPTCYDEFFFVAMPAAPVDK